MQITPIDLNTVKPESAIARSPSERQNASGALPAPQEADPAPAEPSAVTAAIDTINQHLTLEQRAVRVVPRDDAKGPVIEVIDRETEQVIRQIPADNVIKLAAWFDENGMLSNDSPAGLAFDETA